MKDIRTSHDMLLWLDILKNEGYAFGLNQVLASYRLSSNSNTKNKLFAAIDVWRVYRNYERLNVIDSFYNFMHYAFNALKKNMMLKRTFDIVLSIFAIFYCFLFSCSFISNCN